MQGASLDSTTRRQPPKSEFRGPKPERRPNSEGRSHARAFRVSGFGLLSALGFRASGSGLCAHGLVVLSGRALRLSRRLILTRAAGNLGICMNKRLLAALCVALALGASSFARHDAAGESSRLELQGQFKQAAGVLSTTLQDKSLIV